MLEKQISYCNHRNLRKKASKNNTHQICKTKILLAIMPMLRRNSKFGGRDMISRVMELNSIARTTTLRLIRIKNTSFCRLEKVEDLRMFSELAYRNIGVRFPIDFLANSKTIAVINQKGDIAGGFVMAPAKYSRVIASLPDEAIEKLNKLYPNQEQNMFEITGLWLCRSQRSKTLTVRFWTKIYKEVVAMRRPYFIFAYSSKKVKLGEIYSVVKPTRIFEGFTKMMPGMTEPDHEIIEVGSVKMAHLAWITEISFLYKRLFKGRTKSKRCIYH